VNNIIVVNDPFNKIIQVKIVDFGLREGKISEDLWNFGVILWQILSGGKNPIAFLQKSSLEMFMNKQPCEVPTPQV
jgi:hypothetical protein